MATQTKGKRVGSNPPRATRSETATTTTTSQTVTERQELETRTLRTPTLVEVGSSISEVSGSGGSGLSGGSPLSRHQEKEEFKVLNNRLATYIDTIRSQEEQIVQLRKVVDTRVSTEEREIKKVTDAYEREIANLRKALDDTSKEHTQAVTDADNLRAQQKDYLAKNQALESGSKAQQKKVKDAENALKDMRVQFNQLRDDAKDHDDLINTANARIRDLQQQLDALRRELADETVGRVDAQNRLMSAQEELKFQKTIFDEQMTTLRNQRMVEVTETETRMHADYQHKLANQLDQLRDDMEQLANETRADLDHSYKRQMEDLQNLADSNARDLRMAMSELKTTQNRVSEDSKRSDKTIQENRLLIARLEDDLRRKEADNQRMQQMLADRQEELGRLHADLSQQLKIYAALLDEKIQLDAELATYNSLLVSEEQRLNIKSTPFPSTPDSARRGTKRRRDMVSRTSLRNSASATGDIHIVEIDPMGQFVRLANKATLDVAVGGWTLVMKSDNIADSKTTYKIHGQMIIKGHATMTIWSANANVVHDPPTDVVMEGRWLVGEHTSLSLSNSLGEEVAHREMAQDVQSMEESYSGEGPRPRRPRTVGPGAYVDMNGDDHQKNCAIM